MVGNASWIEATAGDFCIYQEGTGPAVGRQIQQAAYAFVEQLQPADRVKVISFDDQVKDLNEFTNKRDVLRRAIESTRPGQGTKVYDAVELALNTIRTIRGRKAIVLFSDGMDWHSDSATFDGTLRWLDEEGVVVYPIRYDTRATTEQLAREQAGQPHHRRLAQPVRCAGQATPPATSRRRARDNVVPTEPGDRPSASAISL